MNKTHCTTANNKRHGICGAKTGPRFVLDIKEMQEISNLQERGQSIFSFITKTTGKVGFAKNDFLKDQDA